MINKIKTRLNNRLVNSEKSKFQKLTHNTYTFYNNRYDFIFYQH